MTANNHLSKGHLALIFGVPLLLILGVVYLTTFPFFASQNFSYAISMDLIFTAPLVYYLLIRKTKISNLTVVTVAILGVFIAYLIIPEEHQKIINLARYGFIPLIEISIVTFIILKIRKLWTAVKNVKDKSPDFFSTLKTAVHEVLPKRVAPAFVLEIAMVYYCFFAWKKPTIPNNAFTYHKKSSLHLIFGVFIGLVLVETFAFHLLVERWSPMVAWIGTGISIYSIIQIIGIIKSASRRPIIFEDEKILLRFGIMSETEVRYKDIEKVELSQRTISNNPLAKKLGTELTSQNVVIYLKKENTLHGLFGIKNKFNTLSLFVDDHKTFKEKIDTLVSNE